MMTCKTCLLQSMVRTNISGQYMSIVRMRCGGSLDVIFASVVCFSLRKSGQEKSGHVYSQGNPDWVIQMRIRATCHQEMCATWHRGRVPTHSILPFTASSLNSLSTPEPFVRLFLFLQRQFYTVYSFIQKIKTNSVLLKEGSSSSVRKIYLNFTLILNQ